MYHPRVFVFQWRYRTGNNWGICPDGSSQLGCGPQEEFRGCSDVAVIRRDSDSDSDSESEFPATGPSATIAGRPRRPPSDLAGPSGGLRRPSDLTAPSSGFRRPSGPTGPSGGLRRPSDYTGFSDSRRPVDFPSANTVTGPSLDAARRPSAGFKRPADFTNPSLPSRRPSGSRPVDYNHLPDLTGPSSAQSFGRPPRVRPGAEPSPELTAGGSAGTGRLQDPRRPPPRSGYHHRPYEAMARRNRTTVAAGTERVPGGDDLDDGFIDIDDNFVDDDGNVIGDDGDFGSPDDGFIDSDDGFIDSSEGFIDTDELEEVDLRELESLGDGDFPPEFDGDNSIEDSLDNPLR